MRTTDVESQVTFFATREATEDILAQRWCFETNWAAASFKHSDVTTPCYVSPLRSLVTFTGWKSVPL